MHYKLYFKIRKNILFRYINLLGVGYIIIISLFLALICVLIYNIASSFALPVLYAISIYFFHSYRKDLSFLKGLFYHNILFLNMIEYALIATPYWAISLLSGYYIDLLLYPIIVIIFSILPQYKLKYPKISNPLFQKGGYEYETEFRINYIFLFLCYIISIIAIINTNNRIFYFLCAIIGLLYCNSLLKKVPYLYLINFLCVKDLWKRTIKMIIYNNLILFIIPFITLLFAKNLCINELNIIVLIYVSSIGLSFSSFLLKIWMFSNSAAQILFIIVLFPVYVVSIYNPIYIVLFIPIILFIAYEVNKKISPLFYANR